jgi:hypothetical protein
VEIDYFQDVTRDAEVRTRIIEDFLDISQDDESSILLERVLSHFDIIDTVVKTQERYQ